MSIYKKVFKITLLSFLSASIFGCGDEGRKESEDNNKKEMIRLLGDPEVAKAVYNASKYIEEKDADVKKNNDLKNESELLMKYGSIFSESVLSEVYDIVRSSKNRESIGEGGMNKNRAMLPEQEINDKDNKGFDEGAVIKKEDKNKSAMKAVFGFYNVPDIVFDGFKKYSSDVGMSENETLVTAMTITYISDNGSSKIDNTQKETIEHLISKSNYRLALAIIDVYAKNSMYFNRDFSINKNSSKKISEWLRKNKSSACYTFQHGCAVMANAIGDDYLAIGEYADAYYFYGLSAIKSKGVEGFHDVGYGSKVYFLLNYLGCTQDRDIWGDFVLYQDGKVMNGSDSLFKGVPYPDVKYNVDLNTYAERISLARNNQVPKLSAECMNQINF